MQRNKRLKRVSGFKAQINADSHKVTGEFSDLPVFFMPIGTKEKTKSVVYTPVKAYKFPVRVPNFQRQPRLVMRKEWRYWEVLDYTTGLALPGCSAEDRESAIAATLATLERVGEDRFWKVQQQNEVLMKKSGVPLNGAPPKPKPVDVQISEIKSATQLSLI